MGGGGGGAQAVLPEFQPYRILYLARVKGGARAPCAPPGYAIVWHACSSFALYYKSFRILNLESLVLIDLALFSRSISHYTSCLALVT